MAKFSIIIRCFNEEAHIGRLLSGIMQQSESDYEIIVVDSGSTDATLSIAAQYPATVLTIRKEDFSFGHSLNVGCERASGEFLVFASAHVYPIYHDWLEQMVLPFENPRIACVYGRQMGDEATKFSEHQVFARWFPEESDFNQTHPFCNNANAAVRRSIWEQNRYDETLTGLEDLAWAKQTISAGFRIAYNSEAGVIHVHDETGKQVLNRYRREAIAMKSVFPHERVSFFSFLNMLVKNIFNDARVALKLDQFWKKFPSIVTFRLMQFWGTYRGYAQRGAISTTLREKFYYPSEFTEQDVNNGTGRAMIDYSGHDKKVSRQ